MRDFIKPLNKVYFGGCNGCVDCCTNYPFVPIFLEEFEHISEIFPIVFAKIGNDWFSLALLYGKKEQCRYLENSLCQIYDKRPGVCKIFPVAPFEEGVFLDSSCSALNEDGNGILVFNENGSVGVEFYHSRIDDFVQKRQLLKQFLEDNNQNMTQIGSVKGVDIFRCNNQNKFCDLHQKSLKLMVQ